MKKRTYKTSNEEVSLLGFGCMRFPMNEDGTINKKETFKMMDYAYEQGVNYYDTAYPYINGTSEIIVGEWLSSKERSSLYLATKSPVWDLHSMEDFYAKLNEQLSKLQTEYIDYYLLHALDKSKWDQINAFDLIAHLDEVKASGKVKKIGFSFHDEYPMFEEILNSYDWDFCQIQYNYMDVDYQAGKKGYELAKSKGIPVIIMEPIKGGQLANVPQEIKTLFNEVAPQKSDASMAMRFVGSHEHVLTVLSGMSTLEQVKDNVNTFQDFVPFSEEEYTVIEKARKIFLERVQVLCTQCGYCMPCPFGVNIPRNFTILNNSHIYDNFAGGKSRYCDLKEAAAHTCVGCRVCVDKCPQHIDIPEKLLQVKEELQ